MKFTVDSKINSHDRMYGITTLGERGQVVIPKEARDDLGLKPGDQLLVIGKLGRVLGLLKADQLGSLIDLIMDHIPDNKKKLKAHIKEHIEEVFNSSTKSKKH